MIPENIKIPPIQFDIETVKRMEDSMKKTQRRILRKKIITWFFRSLILINTGAIIFIMWILFWFMGQF